MERQAIQIVNPLGTCKVVEDSSGKKVKLVLSELLPKGKASLIINFKGVIRDDMLGVYKCKPKEKSKDAPLFIVTHFEPCFAFLCFPCWVDPVLRCPYPN